MSYARRPEWAQADFKAARAFEEEVGAVLGNGWIDRLDSTTDLDYFRPAVWLECKEKRQRLTERWHLLSCGEEDTFVVDELSIRKAMLHAPYAWFLLRDVPGGNRLFLARVDELALSEHVRRNRSGKGKILVCLKDFKQLSSLEDIIPAITADQVEMPWKRSECLSAREIGQI